MTESIFVGGDTALTESLKRKLGGGAGPSVKRSRTDKYNIESTLDPDAEYDNKISKQAKPRPAKSQEKTKSTKQPKAPAKQRSTTKSKASAKQPSSAKTKASTNQQSSGKSKASSKKQTLAKRKTSPKVSNDSTDEQIEVDPTSFIREQQNKANHASQKTSKAPERQLQKPRDKAADKTTPKSPQVIDAISMATLARSSLAAIGETAPQTASDAPNTSKEHSRTQNSTKQNDGIDTSAVPKEPKQAQPRAPIAKMGRAVVRQQETESGAKQDRALPVSAEANKEPVPEQPQPPPEARPIEDTSENGASNENANIDPALLTEQYGASTPQQTDNASRNDAPRKDAPRKDVPRNDVPRKDTPTRDTPRRDTPRKDASRKDTPRKDAPRKGTPRKETPRNDTPRNDTTRNVALLANADVDSSVVSEEHQASGPQQVDNTNQDVSPQASANVDQEEEEGWEDEEEQEEQVIVVEQRQASEPQQVEENRSKGSTKKVPKPPKPPIPSAEMATEYRQNHIPEVEEDAFCNRGSDWNVILQSREVLLENKIKLKLLIRERMIRYWVEKCPLSDKGKKTIRVLGDDAEIARTNPNDIIQNIERYHTELNKRPELIQADLYHLIIPRLIRYIDTIYAQSTTDDDDLGFFDTMSILLKALSESCDTAMHMERHLEERPGTELLGLEPKLSDALEQISDSSRRINEKFRQKRNFLRDMQERQKQEEAARREERRRVIQQQEEEDRQREEEIKQRENERRHERNTAYRHDRELQIQARREARYRAIQQRSEKYWFQDLPSSSLVLNEIHSIEDADVRVTQRNSTRKRVISSSFVWTAALTDVLVDELRKYQDLDINRRYEQCLKCEQLKHLSLGEIRRRSLEVKPWLAEQWLEIKGSVPRYVWTIE